jgi:ssDNA-binding protein
MADEQESKRFHFDAAPITFFYPQVITKKAADYGNGKKGDPSYQIFAGVSPDHPQLKDLKRLLGKTAKEAFGTVEGVSFPIRMGDEIADEAKKRGKNREMMRGFVVLKAGSKEYTPQLFYVSNGEVIEIDDAMRTQAGSKFYSGCEGSIGVNFKAYEGNGKNIPNSVVAYLGDVVSLCRGPKLGGSGAAKYANFAKNVGEVSDKDPTAGTETDDEIPF